MCDWNSWLDGRRGHGWFGGDDRCWSRLGAFMKLRFASGLISACLFELDLTGSEPCRSQKGRKHNQDEDKSKCDEGFFHRAKDCDNFSSLFAVSHVKVWRPASICRALGQSFTLSISSKQLV